MTAPTILPLELDHVDFSINHTHLIKDLSCRFEEGAVSIIVGPNGAGKSLFLGLCHGLIAPNAGRITWHGAGAREPRLFQAMVFQRPVMLRRSVYANIDFALSVRKVPRPARRALIEEALARTGIERFATVSARVLSYGEQQRLALARSWAMKPQVLFLDEPTASTDPAATHVIEEVVGAMKDAGTKIIMTTHDLHQARRLADEVLFMHRGRLLEKAPAAQFFENPANELARAFMRGELLWWHRRELTPS